MTTPTPPLDLTKPIPPVTVERDCIALQQAFCAMAEIHDPLRTCVADYDRDLEAMAAAVNEFLRVYGMEASPRKPTITPWTAVTFPYGAVWVREKDATFLSRPRLILEVRANGVFIGQQFVSFGKLMDDFIHVLTYGETGVCGVES